jgi:hypothetical protein
MALTFVVANPKPFDVFGTYSMPSSRTLFGRLTDVFGTYSMPSSRTLFGRLTIEGAGVPGVVVAIGGILGWRRRGQKAAWVKCTEMNGGGPVRINTSYIAHAEWDGQKQATVVTFRIGRNDTITVKEAPLHILGGR